MKVETTLRLMTAFKVLMLAICVHTLVWASIGVARAVEIKPSIPEPEMVVANVIWGTLEQTIESCITHGAWAGDTAAARRMRNAGCSVWMTLTEGNPVMLCTIYAVRPKTMNDMETLVLGHEFLHCLYGRYHPQ